MTDEIWKRGDTIDFVVGKHETSYWRRLLRDYGIKVKVLEHNIKEHINDDFIKKYINTRRGNALFVSSYIFDIHLFSISTTWLV